MTIDRWISSAPPARPAIAFEGRELAYGEFAAATCARARALAERGVRRGDRVAWFGLNRPEAFVLLFACARLGAMLLPLNWRLADKELDAVVAAAKPSVMVCDAHCAGRAARFGAVPEGKLDCAAPTGELPGGGAMEDPVLLVFTSGATGRPKGVVLTQAALAANAAMSVEAHDLAPEDRALVALPLFHVGGLNILGTPAFSAGASVELHERFDAAAAAEALSRVQHAITVPTMLQAIMEAPGWAEGDLSGLRTLSIGSTDVPAGLVEAVHARGVPLLQVYGATETGPMAIYQRRADTMETAGTIGRAGSRCEIRLVDADGGDVPDGVPGEILVRGENVARKYWRAPALTKEAFRDGWFRTGDVAVRTPEGLYHFVDRIKHVVISGGENIYPAEIERVLRGVAGVEEVSVVGLPDPKWGEVPAAVVVGGAAPAEIREALAEELARYKHPGRVFFADALPRNAMGKVAVDEVRAMAREMAAADPGD